MSSVVKTVNWDVSSGLVTSKVGLERLRVATAVVLGMQAGSSPNVERAHRRNCLAANRTAPVAAAGQATQVVSHGRHHHNRSLVVSGLNVCAGSPQNRHSGPPPVRPSIHPVVLAVAACIPSNMGVRFTPRTP